MLLFEAIYYLVCDIFDSMNDSFKFVKLMFGNTCLNFKNLPSGFL